MKTIDIKTQEGLDQLKAKAKFYGHYAQNLMVLELINEIEELRASTPEAVQEMLALQIAKLGW